MHSRYCLCPRHAINCIVPPHVLREIARRGNKAQQGIVLDTLSRDSTHRSRRATTQLMAPRTPQTAAAVAGHVQRAIYTSDNTESLPGRLLRAEGQEAGTDVAVNEAYDGLGMTFEFYMETFQRNSIDGQGMQLIASVHFDRDYDNAFFDGHQMVFGDGDGTIFNRFTIDLDVIGHELTHGVTGSEINLTYLNQSGALNESISDVFGSMIKQYALKQSAADADWLIGGGLLKFPGQALRSMKAPGTAYNNDVMGKDPQPADMAHFVKTTQDNGGVHINSGIPNRAFFLVATALGGHSWEKAGQIWYDTIRDRSIKPSADFATFAAHTVLNAGHRYGTASPERKAVQDAWRTVGVKVK